MRLLIVTQAVDLDDPVLGFFHRWIEEFAKHAESIEVICLKRGRVNLPSNVSVHSLGKEENRGRSFVKRVRYVVRFYRYLWRLRKQYDAVFVHMNQEYVLLGGLLWHFGGTRVILWRNHKVGSFFTKIAARLSSAVCYTSSAAYVTAFENAHQMPIGIDTATFVPHTGKTDPATILFLGRLDPVKHVDVFIKALEKMHDTRFAFNATIVGDSTDPASKYAHDARNLVAPLVLEGFASMRAGVTNEEAAHLFASHAVYCNLTPSGSFDKTIGEAMASGCLVVTSNDAVRKIVPGRLFVAEESIETVARALSNALSVSSEERTETTQRQRSYIEQEHSLSVLAEKLFQIFSSIKQPLQATS